MKWTNREIENTLFHTGDIVYGEALSRIKKKRYMICII